MAPALSCARVQRRVALSRPSARPHAERPASGPAANPAAQRQALRVRKAGMYRINGAHLGASRIAFDPAQLQLHHDGQEVGLQITGGKDGRIDGGNELHFYAPDPGDRWNGAATYWLTYEDQPGRRIQHQGCGAMLGPQRTTGTKAGSWEPHTIYDSIQPGPDGDHWFANALRSDPEASPITILLTTTLLPAAGPVTITITGSTSTAARISWW